MISCMSSGATRLPVPDPEHQVQQDRRRQPPDLTKPSGLGMVSLYLLISACPRPKCPRALPLPPNYAKPARSSVAYSNCRLLCSTRGGVASHPFYRCEASFVFFGLPLRLLPPIPCGLAASEAPLLDYVAAVSRGYLLAFAFISSSWKVNYRKALRLKLFAPPPANWPSRTQRRSLAVCPFQHSRPAGRPPL